MEDKNLSIVIPLFNAENTISRCLESLKSLDLKNSEVIIVDDGSTDSSLDIIKSANLKVKVISQPNKGACSARNLGLALAKGKYVRFLDSDDQIESLNFNDHMDAARLADSNEIVYGDNLLIKSFTKPVVAQVELSRGQPVGLVNSNIQTGMSIYPKKALDSINGFDERLKFRQEFDLNLRLSLKGYRFRRMPIVVQKQYIDNREGRISSRTLNISNEIENLDLIRENCHYNSVVYDEAWSYKYWTLARQFIKLGDYRAASIIMEKSKSISKNYKSQWPTPYRFLVSLFGVYNTERLISFSRLVKR